MANDKPNLTFTPSQGGNVRFGRYEIIGKLAAGGMATVFLARHRGVGGFERLFALKVLHAHLAEQMEFVTMLLDEAQLASRLHHPNVVPIVDLGEHEGQFFLVMDYVEGCSLSQLSKRTPDERPARLLIPLVVDALEGLQAAHELRGDDEELINLVHRDMSPQNVLVGVDGIGRVIDFGIARAESRLTSTRPGTLKGKIAFMSPEQVGLRDDLDARSDIFSVGTMLWTLLTGKRLFVADSVPATLSNILDMDIPKPSAVAPHLPEYVDDICLRALQRDPDKRFQTAIAMADALREAATLAGDYGGRQEIASCVRDKFKNEFAARRQAIRKRDELPVVTEQLKDYRSALPSLVPFSSDQPVAPASESSTLTSVDGSDTSVDGGDSGTKITAAVEAALASRSRRRLWLWGAAAIAIGGGLLLWRAAATNHPPNTTTVASTAVVRPGGEEDAPGEGSMDAAADTARPHEASASASVVAPPTAQPSAEAAAPSAKANSKPKQKKRSKSRVAHIPRVPRSRATPPPPTPAPAASSKKVGKPVDVGRNPYVR